MPAPKLFGLDLGVGTGRAFPRLPFGLLCLFTLVAIAWGVARLCERLGIERDDVVAFGDALNDVELLAWAGHGVAVANAVPEAVAVADEVTATNDEDGVAQVLERLLRS